MPSTPRPVLIRLRVQCPHCDAPATARSSVSQTQLHRDIYYQCTNLMCGCAFVATLEICRIVTPSQIPRPGVRLPILERGSHKPLYPPAPPANDTLDEPEAINTG